MKVDKGKANNRANLPVLTEEEFKQGVRIQKYYEPLYPYPDGSAKRGTKTKYEKELIQTSLKVINKEIILNFD